MSPEKLFDYLEGKFTAEERQVFEDRLANDPQLQRELEIAREMHRRSPRSREVLGENDDSEIPLPPKPIGKRLITAFAALVLLNVIVGILFIIGRKSGTGEIRAREEAARKQLESSLQKTAETSMPLPTVGDEVHLPSAMNDRDRVADNVVVLAEQAGGSAAKAPADSTGINVIVDLPSNRVDEFRRSLIPLAPPEYSPPPIDASATAERRTLLQVRVGDRPALTP